MTQNNNEKSWTLDLSYHSNFEDERKNKVGRIKDDELFLLDSIEPCSKFRLEQTSLKRLGKSPTYAKTRIRYAIGADHPGF